MATDPPTRPLRIRAPGTPLLLRELLARACPRLGPDPLDAWVRTGAIRVAERVTRDLDAVIEPGQRVDVDVAPGDAPLGPAAWPALRASEGRAFVLTVSSPWARGVLAWTLEGASNETSELEFEVCGEADGVSELELGWPPDAASIVEGRGGRRALDPSSPDDVADEASFGVACRILEALARGGLCVLGDPFHGGLALAGGPAWRSASAGSHMESGDWPEPPVFVEAPRGAGRPAWMISDATARVLARGHPWVRLDDETSDPSPFAPGARIDLVTGDGRRHGQALIEGAGRNGPLALREGDVAARIVGVAGGAGAPSDWSIEASVARAVERRADLLADSAHTDAFRLVHGEADGLPGLHIDRLGPLVRVLVTARCALPLVDRALAALGGAGPRVVPDPWRVIEVVHLDERVPGRFERVRVHPYSGDAEGAAALGAEAMVREEGLTYVIEPGLAEPDRSAPGFGLFLDQRENRARFAARVRAAAGAGRYLNLFAHTGAFSVAWLAAGAGEVVSVDLSASVLRRLEANLAANVGVGVDPGRHLSVRQDGRRYLERLGRDDRFDGIVLDPPTAAAAGRRFFSVRKDVVPMIGQCLTHLAPGGRLLVTLNDRKTRRRLESAIAEAAASMGIALRSVEPAPPSRDFPVLEGFEEGDSFRGFWVRV